MSETKKMLGKTITKIPEKPLPTIMSGERFKELYKDTKMYKLTNINEKHNNLQIVTGLNIDVIDFNPNDECKAGGIYFCEFHKVGLWYYLNGVKMEYYREVILPDDAKIYREKNSFKADKLILGEKKPIWSDNIFCKEIVMRNGNALEFVVNKTEELCMIAVSNFGLALQFVDIKTDAICLAAVSSCGLALQFVDDQSEKICVAAIKQHELAIKYVDIQTAALALIAVNKNIAMEKYIDEDVLAEVKIIKNNEINELIESKKKSNFAEKDDAKSPIHHSESVSNNDMIDILKIDGLALEHVQNQTIEMCLCALKQNGLALQYVRNPTELLIMTAMEQNPNAAQYIDYSAFGKQAKTDTPPATIPDKIDSKLGKKFDTLTTSEKIELVKKDGLSLKEMSEQTEEICIVAVNQTKMALKYVKDVTINVCLQIIKNDKESMKFVIEHCYSNKVLELLKIYYYATYVENVDWDSYDDCMKQVIKNPSALCFAKIQTDEMVAHAISINAMALEYAKKQTYINAVNAVKKNPFALQFVINQVPDEYPELCHLAVAKNPAIMQYVKDQTDEFCLYCYHRNRNVFQYIRKPSSELIEINIVDKRKYKCDYPKDDSDSIKDKPDPQSTTRDKTTDITKYVSSQNAPLSSSPNITIDEWFKMMTKGDKV
jgi:hypothetical protein